MSARHDTHWMLSPQIPAIYSQAVLNVARDRGLDCERLLEEAGLDAVTLNDPAALVVSAHHMCLVMQILAHTGNNGLGFEIGLTLPLTTHGSLGFAMLCCSSLREALPLLARYWSLRERGAELQVLTQEGAVVVELTTSLVLPKQVDRVLFECLLTTVFRSLQMLLGTREALGCLLLVGPVEPYHARFAPVLPPCHHDMPAWRFVVPEALLDCPLPMANAGMLQQAVAQCERELALLQHPYDDVLERVREALILSSSGYPSQAQLAEQLHMSLRTVRRRLQLCGTSYRELLDVARRRDALRLLETTHLSIQSIAARLGYLNPTNFARAFRHWTGRSPREYRTLRLIP